MSTGQNVAQHYGSTQTFDSDIHDMGRLAKGEICTEHKICTPEDLNSVLRSNEYTLIETED